LRTRCRARVGALLLSLAAGLAANPAYAAGEKEELARLRAQIEQAKRELATAEGAHAEAADQLRASESAISDANRALRELGAMLGDARAELRRLGAETRTARGELDAHEAQLAALVRARYIAGSREVAKLLLSGEDANQKARTLAYHEFVSQAQAELIRDLRERVARLAALEQRARETGAELAALERQAQAERARLVAQAAERRAVLARISGDIGKQRRKIETLGRNEQRLAGLVDRLARALRSAPPPQRAALPRNEQVPEASGRSDFAGSKGRLRLPVRGELASRFGTPREGSSLTWKGLLILAPQGEDVQAVADGRVVFADWMRGFGNLLILDHGGGYLTIYGNNESVLRQVGDAVHGGDVVATVGATGGAQASGLYFEMRYQGKPFDPLSWVTLK
jgi:septal ring factor EnvC (AmiA/AmiB activator)